MAKENKVWEKPELIVLVRSKPEEAVLTGCKTEVGPLGQGPVGDFWQCSAPASYPCSGDCLSHIGS